MLSGPQLVQVTPNTGPAINLAGGTVENQSPTQVVLNFTAGSAITPTAANLANITVTRSGGDGVFGAAGSIADLPVTIGSVQVDSQNSNQVIVRFANTLVDDSYQIQISGALTSSSGAFNSGKAQTVNFAVDSGAQVVSVVPQPVLRTEVVTVNGTAATLDGQAVSISTGGGTPVNFFLSMSGSLLPAPPVGPNNVTVTYNPGDSNSVIAGDLAIAIQTAATTGGNANLIGTLVTSPTIPSTLSSNQFSLTGTAFTPTVTASASQLRILNAGLVTDGYTFTIVTPNPANPAPLGQTFQFHNLAGVGTVSPSNVAIGFNPGDSAGKLAAAMVAAINTTLGANSATFYGATLTVANAANISDLDKFTVTPAVGAAVTFQFKDSTTASVVAAGSVAIVYNPGDSAATLTNRIVTAIGGSSLGAAAVVNNGGVLKFTGNVAVAATTKTAGVFTTVNGLSTVLVNGNRTVALSASTGFLSVATGLVVSEGGLTPSPNIIDVYFSQDPLNAALARDPAFYQVINTANGSTLQPTSVVYNSVGNTAVLTFANALPTGTLQLTVGAPKTNNTTIATAIDLGSLGSSNNLVSATPILGTLTGTSWTNGSATVTGSGFLSAVAGGEFLVGPDGANYQVLAGFTDTSLTLATTFAGASQTGITTSIYGSPMTSALVTVGQQSLTPVLGTLSTTAWTNGLANVIGTGTTFITSLKTGEFVLGPDGKFYTIQTINSNTSLTLSTPFTGVTQASFTANFYNTRVTWNGGSTAVTGTGAGLNFLATLQVGQVLQGPDGNFYTIASVNSATSLTLATNFGGITGPSASASALPFGAYRTVGFIGDGTVGGVAASTSTSAFNLYKFQTPSTGTESVTILATNIAAGLGGAVQITLFDSAGTPIANSITGILTVPNLAANSQFIVGVSGTGNTYNPVTGVSTAPGTGIGSYNVSIGITNPIPQALDTTSFATATNLGSLGVAGATLNNTIQALTNIVYPALPGGTSYPGNRNIPLGGETDAAEPSGPSPSAIPVFEYNFQDVYGVDPQGNTLHNAITENQKNDARQIFDIYGQYLGVKFVETASSGLTVVTGDIRAVAPSIDPTAAGGIAGGGEVVMNAAFDYGSSPYGGSWFTTAFHEIGHALGLVHIGDAPGVMNASAEDPTNVSTIPPAEPVFPGDTALVSAERINPPDSVDLNTYQFTLAQGGTFTAETLAQRLTDPLGNADPSNLDTVITVYSTATAQATVSSDFNTSGAMKIAFTAKAQGLTGNGITLVFTKSDLGANIGPAISVSGSQISIVLNTDAVGATTANTLVSAINNDLIAGNVITASIASGSGATNIAAQPNVGTLSLIGGQGSRSIIARNDNYFGNDSFVSLHLAAGTYFVVVSASGNTNFDPSIADSGFGGRTDGDYQLKLNFTPDPVGASFSTLNDAGLPNFAASGGVALDGDGQNAPGGAFNFWFQSTSNGPGSTVTGNTIFVDKLNFGDNNQDGSSLHPYSTISQALQAATNFESNSSPGTITIIRIVGNGGGDANAATTGDTLPYLVGFDTLGNPEQDGSTFIVPQNVTVMIDAGAVIKLHSAIIDVGNTTPNIDRSGGALQVLGTPSTNVTFTSLFNDAIGGRSDLHNFSGPNAGDWGGLVFQQSGDFQGYNYQGKGIYLNSVNQSFLTFGGGQVIENAVLQVFDPIHISNPDPTAKFFDRPAVWFNTITLSADSALSADPNSFDDSEDRIGPDVYGNFLLKNSVNGFFIRIRTNAGQPIDTLGVSARIDHLDVTYVLAENLFIDGNPGGPFEPDPSDPTHTGWNARLGASLVLDPGIILKLSGSHIQAQVGHSQLIAEGTASQPIIFTSLNDNSYGADGTGAGFTNPAGSFQTSNNPAATPAPGDWGGIFFNADSSGSLDHAVVQYAGGQTTIAGGFAHFNPIEIQQAEVRIANTSFLNNASGDASGDADPTREGLQVNDGATIFVRGAQPVIIDNTFINNRGFIISVNANALNSDVVPDWGRSTGGLDAFSGYTDNHGPLVAQNVETGNGFNGMEVRGEEVTTQTFWDDTDIVHIVTSEIDDVINQHTFGGITLESNATSSLVVKLAGPNAGFLINGVQLDETDRIGGTFQSIGSPGHPVIMTSLFDSTVGAGFQPNGQPLLKTDGAAVVPPAAAGDWAGINLGPYSNDRNVATVFEQQSTSTLDNNSTPLTAQALGNLAPDLATDTQGSPQGGNDYQALGFAVHGTLNQPSDVDVYSFTANAGTEVWFQIGLSSPALASVLELVDSNGNVLASSNASTGTNVLSGLALNMIKDPNFGGVFYSENPRDAGMRVILPGASGSNSTYYIRMRSDHGLTKGEYQLQIRLRQQWESPGSVIEYSTVNYSTNGIQLNGLPNNSPLSGTTNSVGGNNTFQTAQNLGDMLTSNQSSITVSGTLNTSTQVDWYKFTLQYNLIESIASANSGDKTFATEFAINYAAGLARPDTTISVYDSTGTLIFVARDGNVSQNTTVPDSLTNLSGGSFSPLDPFLGSVQLPAGAPTSPAAPFTYFVAISSNAMIPTALDGVINSGSSNTPVRLQPVNSVQRIVEDHIGFTGYTTGDKTLGVTVPVQPADGAVLPIDSTAKVAQEVVPWSLTDVVLYTVGGGALNTVNPFTGAAEYTVTNAIGTAGNRSIQMRADGTLWMYAGIPGDQNDVGQLVQLDPGTGATLAAPTPDAIPKFTPAVPPAVPDPNGLTSDTIDSFTWVPNLGEPGGFSLYYAAEDTGRIWDTASVTSRLYRADPATLRTDEGSSPYIVVGQLATSLGDTATGTTNGMAVVNGTVYGVSSTGKFYTIDLGSGLISYINTSGPGQLTSVLGAGVGFTGLTIGPQNVADSTGKAGAFANLLFATTTNGKLVCFDTAGNVQSIFNNGASTVSVGGATGLAFSPLDFNLWHPTTAQQLVAGHGVLQSPDQSNNKPGSFSVTVGNTGSDTRKSDEGAGGASYYFGLEAFSQAPPTVANGAYIQYQNGAGALTDAQYGIQTSGFQKALTSNVTTSTVAPNYQNTYNLPGGAHGTLVTDSFSLATYSSQDLPTLYINYLLQTDPTGANGSKNTTDSARIWVSQDNGVTWQLAATNNLLFSSPGSPAFSSGELPSYLTQSVADNASDSPLIGQVQPLYGTNTWRQARIDLANYAGQPNLRLRFDFDTSGTVYATPTAGTTPAAINAFGAGPNKAVTGQNNNFAGWYIDDIIVGFANRGEMVTGATANNTGFTPLPQNPAFGAPAQALTGPYELNIRPGQIYGSSISPIASPIVVGGQFDDNQPMVNGFTINAPAGSNLTDGQTFTITDGVKTVVFEFDSNGVLNLPTDQRVTFAAGDTNVKVAESIRDAINAANAAGKFSVTAALTDGTVTGTGSPQTSTDPNVRVIGAVSLTGITAGPILGIQLGATTINESGAGNSTTVKLTRPAGLPAGSITVNLAAINVLTGAATTAAGLPASFTFTFAANGTVSTNSTTLTATNNGLQDGTRTIAVVPSANGFTSSNATVDVIDDESPSLTLTVSASVNEGSTGNITVTRNTVAALNTNPLVVTLTSLDPTRLQVPATVTILAGQASVTVNGAIQALVNGTQGDTANIGITASADGFASNTQSVSVVDTTAFPTPQLNPTPTNVDTTAGIAGNQTNGAIAIDPVFSATSGFNTGGAVSVAFAANGFNFPGASGSGINLLFNKSNLGDATLITVTGSAIDGQQFTVNDGTDGNVTFQFHLPGGLPLVGSNVPVTFAFGDTGTVLATKIAAAINGVGWGLTGLVATASGAAVTLTEGATGPAFAPLVNLDTASPTTVLTVQNVARAPSIKVVGQQVQVGLNQDTTPVVATDFNTNSAVDATFAAKAAVAGTPISLTFTKADLGDSAPGVSNLPTVSVAGNAISVVLNTDISATASTTFNGTAATVLFTGKTARVSAVTVHFAAPADLGANTAPTINVAGNTITVTLNNNAGTPTTAQQFVTAFNANAGASALLTASVSAGGATNITTNTPIPDVVVRAPTPSTANDVKTALDNFAAAFALISTTITGNGLTDVTSTITTPAAAPTLVVTIHAPQPTTAQQLVTAINNPLAASSTFVSAAVSSGIAGADITTSTVNGTPLNLGQVIFSISQNAGGAGTPLNPAISFNGGTTWINLPQIATGNAGDLPAATGDLSKPQLATDLYGNLFLVYEGATGTALNMAISSDFGQHWTQMASFTGGNFDAPSIAAGVSGGIPNIPGTVWVAYRDTSGKNISVKSAGITGLGTFNAGAFAGTTVVPGSNGAAIGGFTPSIQVGPLGAVAVAWQQPIPTGVPGMQILVSVDPDGLGPSFFSFPVVAAVSGIATNSFIPANPATDGIDGVSAAPSISWDTTTGRLYLVYVDKTGSNNNTDIFEMSALFSGGSLGSFGVPKQVNDDITTNSQFMPRIAVDNIVGSATRGDAVVTWADARNAGAANNTVQEFGALISNNGATISPNVQLSAGTTTEATTNNNVGLGEYTGLDFSGGKFFPLWADNSATLVGNTGTPTLDEATCQGTINNNPTPLPTATVSFGAGPFIAGVTNTGTVTLSAGAPNNGFIVTLSSVVPLAPGSLATATFPLGNTITFSAGQTVGTFSWTVAPTGIATVEQTAVIAVQATGYDGRFSQVDVIDSAPKPVLTIGNLSSTTVAEGNQITGTVTRNTPTTSPLVVTLWSTSPSHLSAAQGFAALTTVTILAGATSANFTLTGVQDFTDEGGISFATSVVAAAEGFASAVQPITVTDSEVTMVSSYHLSGDLQIPKPQGHIQIINNSVSYTANVGISVTGGPNDPFGNLPHPGSVRNLPTLDSIGLVPGPNIVNNVVDHFGVGGILFSGTPSVPGQPTAAIPYGRIVNNTIYGGGTVQGGAAKVGTGITVSNNAAPTLTNNIVANTALGISVDGSSTSKLVNGVSTPLTVVATEVFQNNAIDGVLGTNSIQLGNSASIFVKPATGNFYLREGTAAIDSSLNTLPDNAKIDAVLSAIGLPQSPIIAPTTDRFGQLRIDDPFVPNATGLGSNIFVDRGAVERADFVGPTGQLIVPLDNGPSDGDPTLNSVLVTTSTPLTQFSIQLSDNGIGIDNSTVVPAAFTLKQGNTTLINGVDYIFVYNANTHTVLFQSTSVFNPAAVFTITVDISAATGVKDLAGNSLQANQTNGTEVFTIVGNVPPALTNVNLLQGLKNTGAPVISETISYANLRAQSDLSVLSAHSSTAAFIITQVGSSGTLTISKNGAPAVPVVPGTTISAGNTNLVSPPGTVGDALGDVLFWTPTVGLTGVTPAFQIEGYDPQNAIIAPQLDQSLTPVQVSFNLVDPSPVITTITSPLAFPAGKSAQYNLSFTSLLNATDAHTVDGTQIGFIITNIPVAGSVSISHNGGAPVLASVGSTVGLGDSIIWTAPATAGVTNAFSVAAFDLFNFANTSTSPFDPGVSLAPFAQSESPPTPLFAAPTPAGSVPVNVTVLNATAPTLASINTLTDPRFVPTPISFNTLYNNAVGVSTTAANTGFRIESVTSGTLTDNGVAVVPGTTVVVQGDNLVWTSAPGATGLTGAFTVSAIDLSFSLASASPVPVNINLVNVAPVLTTINTLSTANQQTPFQIPYGTLLAQSNASDANNDQIQFRIMGVQNGTMTITHAGVTSAVVAGVTLLAAGDSLTWTGASGVNGNGIPAFTVAAFDGTVNSSTVQVLINVQPLGAAYNLTGVWTINSGGTTASVLGRISQTGANLTFVNQNGIGSSGQFTGFSTLSVANFDNQANVLGTVDTTAADDGRILFADGTVWLRVSLAGTYSVTGPGISSPTLATINQSGNQLTLLNGGSSTVATISSPTQLQVASSGGTSTASYGDGKISFNSNGQVWTKLDLPTNFTNQSGAAVQVLSNGTSITFVNKFGATTPAFWTSPTTLFLTAWNETVTTGLGTLTFQDGSIWSMNLSLNGANNGTGTTNISAAPSTLYVFDYINGSGKPVHLIQTGTNSVLFIFANNVFGSGQFVSPTQLTTPVAPNDIATISNDFSTISWQDGTVWTQTAPTGAVTLTNATNGHGIATHLIQNGSTQVAFIDSVGNIIIGNQVAPNQFVTALYGPSDLATVSGNTVNWQDGSVWTPQGGAVPVTVTFTDQNGAAFHVKLTSSTTLVAVDGVMAGLSATRLNGKLFWSNGQVWNDFDFNALNALFEMTLGYH